MDAMTNNMTFGARRRMMIIWRFFSFGDVNDDPLSLCLSLGYCGFVSVMVGADAAVHLGCASRY
jgi:hypothetical protein